LLQPSFPLIKAVGNIPSGAGSAKSRIQEQGDLVLWDDDAVVFQWISLLSAFSDVQIWRRSALHRTPFKLSKSFACALEPLILLASLIKLDDPWRMVRLAK
jgi:hypothetical protein